MSRVSIVAQAPQIPAPPNVRPMGSMAGKPSTAVKSPAPVVTASPTLLYTDVNGTLRELVSGSARAIPAVRNLMGKSPQLAAAMLNVASSPISNAIRWELGFATDGKSAAADIAKSSSYSLILKFNPAALKASPDFGRFTSSLEPVLKKEGVSRLRAAIEAVRSKSGSDVRLYIAPRDDGGVDLSLGVSTVVVPTRNIGTAPRRVGTGESVPHAYGLAQVITRVPLNNQSTRPGAQMVLAAGFGRQGKQLGVEVAGAKVFSYKHNGGSLGFVQKNGEFGVVVPHKGKQHFVSLGKDGAPIAALTGKSASAVPQSSLPTLDRKEIAKEIEQTLPRSTSDKVEEVMAAAKAAGPYASFATDVAPYVAAVVAPNPLTIGAATVDAVDKYTAAEKAMTDSWRASVKTTDFEPFYRSFMAAPLEEKSRVIEMFADQVRKQVAGKQPDAKATYDAWKRIADMGYSSPAGKTTIAWDRYEQGFHERRYVRMSDFVDALGKIVVNGSVGDTDNPSTVMRDLSSINVKPLQAPPTPGKPKVGNIPTKNSDQDQGLVHGTGPNGRRYNGMLRLRVLHTGYVGYYFRPANGPAYRLESTTKKEAMQEVRDAMRRGDYEGMTLAPQ
jgi:hypothetical protein